VDPAAPGALVQPGQVVVAREDGSGAPRHLRLAWRSALSGRCLLVTRQGARHLLLSASEFDDALARGALVARAGADPVEAAVAKVLGAGDG
jgi:hypothetical protein